MPFMRINHFLLVICMLCGMSSFPQQSVIDSLQNIISKNKRDSVTAKALYNLSFEYMRRDISAAKKSIWRAKALSKELRRDYLLAMSYSQLVNIHRSESNVDSVNFYIEELRELAENTSIRDYNKVNFSYYSSHGLNLKKNGKAKEALPFLLKAYEFANKIKSPTDASGQAINIGNCYSEIGDYTKCLEYFLLALKGFENTGNKKGQSYCYNNISSVYYKLNRFPEALETVRKSIKLKNELGDKGGIANGEQNLGNIYMGMEQFSKAETHFKKAIAINSEFKNQNGLMENYYNLARLKNETDPKAALALFRKSREIAIANRDSALISKIDLEMLVLKKADYEKQVSADSSAIANINILKAAGNKYQETFGYKNLADYYIKNKEYEKALEFMEKFHTMQDSLRSDVIQAKFKTIEEQFNKEKNEKQIVILQKNEEISERKLSRQRFLMIIFGLIIVSTGIGFYMFLNRNRLKQQMKELELRNRIAADLHDEVGSSLSSIYMLSQMAGKSQFDAKGDIIDIIKTNSKETMERMGDIVWMIKPSENEGEGLKYRMERFVHEICNSREIDCSFEADGLDEVKLNMRQKKNVYLIFKEAVNNTVKYSNTKKLDIKITNKNKNLEMVIKDFGTGFDQKTVLKGNGLENMQQRAFDLNGLLAVNSSPDGGTEIQLSFPIG